MSKRISPIVMQALRLRRVSDSADIFKFRIKELKRFLLKRDYLRVSFVARSDGSG